MTIHAIDNLFMWIILGLLGLCFVLGVAIGAEINASQLRDETDATLCEGEVNGPQFLDLRQGRRL
jgi:hypothetical protein